MKKYTYLILITLVTAGITIQSCKKKDPTEPDPIPSPTPTPPPALMTGEQTGNPFTTGQLTRFTFAHNEGSVLLIGSNNTTGKVYAIDINDKDSTQAAANAITGSVANFASTIASQLGTTLGNLQLINMQRNPLSKSIYILARNISANTYTLFKATGGGSSISAVDLSSVSYVELPFSTSSDVIWDMTWGDNTLYISYSQNSGLNGKVAEMKAPFANGTAFTERATTVYKTNWGGNYFTSAPLQTMTFGVVDGESRLMGVTVCAPGYSFKTSDITSGTGLLEVKEWYNLNTAAPLKVFPMYPGSDTYLIEHHANGRITRVGKRYLNETESNFNATAKYILASSGTTVAAGLTDADVKIVAPAGTYAVCAKYDESQVMVVNTSGALSLLNI